jgi:tetratricopeptide (TPR) repeat protein
MRHIFAILIALLIAPVSFAASSGPSSGGGGMDVPRQQTPKDIARSAYNDGLRAMKKADKQATKGRDGTKGYERARDQFTVAVQNVATMHEAWNGLGYSRRKLGDYDGALVAYDKALALRPSYSEAIEYRGEAYLALNRVDDAKQAYLDLYVGDRKLADKLLAAMKTWVTAKRSAGADASLVDSLDQWVQERTQIAAQTASLTRSGASEGWR